MASKMLSPNSNYYHCDELMRSNFSESKWTYHYDRKIVHIHSSIGTPWYKGIDVILKTAKILKEQGVSIEWNVYGLTINDAIVRYFIKRLDIKPSENGVYFRGRVDGQQICKGLLTCDVYVHPSYIENSSNAMAEAMMLGVPTIAQYVGGNKTMLKDGSGILVPPGSPYDLAYAIMEMREKKIAENYSENALKVASQRQNTNIILSDLMNIYQNIINSK
jgi:glycosyltransferase involved in cell wall biosynthesis